MVVNNDIWIVNIIDELSLQAKIDVVFYKFAKVFCICI